ncbi:MAG: hypothetical protein M3014_12330 [Chloroflexota bacterium]|nr:hypothetical protein [Chloroflexota bacterium]
MMERLTFARMVRALMLVCALLPLQQRPAHAAGCQSPLTPGHYTGSLGYLVEATREQAPFTIDNSIQYEAAMDLDIACDGQITGKFFRNGGSAADSASQFIHGKWNMSLTDPAGLMDEKATCDLSATWQVVKGHVSAGAGGRPRIDWTFKTGLQGRDCTGDSDLVTLLEGIMSGLNGSSATFDQRDVSWQATGSSASTASSNVPWDDPIAAHAFGKLQEKATAHQTANWSISLSGPPPPTATPKKSKKAPVVSFVHGQLQEFFLESTPAVTNNYSADIDWRGEQPGSVTFQLDNDAPVAAQVEGNSATAAIEIDNLTAGQNHTITVTAISDGGTAQSPPFTVNIVAVPPWAEPYKLQADAPEAGASSVLYNSTASVNIPAEPLEALLTIPRFVPFVGGTWGIRPSQFQTGLAVNSGGDGSNVPITGAGGFVVGGKEIPVQVDNSTSVVRTKIVNNEVQFVTDVQPGDIVQAATVNFKVPDQTLVSKKLSLIELIPGLSTLLDSGKVGKDIKQFDSSLVQATITGEFSGKGRLGVPNNKVSLIGGSGTMGVNVLADASISVFGLASGGVQGNVHGTATFDFSLPPNFTDCSLDAAVFFKYSVIGFGSGTFPNPPTATQLASCSAFGSGRAGSFLMAPAAATIDPPKLTPRSATWKPEQIVASPVESGTAKIKVSTLVEHANALLASPALASTAGGRMALAWVSEAPDRPRPQAWHIALRLFDGKSWGAAIPLGNGADPSYSPSVAFDGKGHAIVAWAQASGSLLTTSAELTDDMLRSLDIAYSVVDLSSGNIVKSGTMPGDGVMDFAPQLAAARDGSVWLAWESSKDAWFVAPDDAPNRLQAARWDGETWQPAEQVSSTFSGVTSWRLAAADAGAALIIAARGGKSGEVIALARAGNGWQPEQKLAGDLQPDVMPAVAYDPSGKAVAAWSSGGEISGVIGDLKAAPSRWLTSEENLAGLVPGDGGKLAVLLSGQTTRGKTVAAVSRFDPSSNSWSAPAPLAEGDSAMLTLQGAGSASGDLAAVMARPVRRTAPVNLANGKTAAIVQAPELAGIELVRVVSAVQAPPTESLTGGGVQPIPQSNGSLIIGGGIAAAMIALAGVFMLVVRARSR